MNVFYFCARAFIRHICGVKGKGKLCLPVAGLNVFRQSVLLSAVLCVCVTPATAQQPGDSLVVAEAAFCPRQLIVPSALIAVGAFGVDNGWFCSVKGQVRDGLQDLRGDCRFKADDYLQYLPVAANVGLGLAGAKTRHTLAEQLAATATAYAAMGLMVNVTKYAVGEKRPDSEARNSFPSGHTATAFMGAELVREEYGTAYGSCAYAFATGIAVLRLYNDRHWLNDVIAGAGVGILSARIGYWLLPWERKLLGIGKAGTAVAVVPAYDYANKGFGVSMAASF